MAFFLVYRHIIHKTISYMKAGIFVSFLNLSSSEMRIMAVYMRCSINLS